MREQKEVTYKHLKIGQEISGIKQGNRRSGFRAYVKDVNPAFVTVEMWKPDGAEEKINADAMFLIEMTDAEIREKYNKKAAAVVKSIQNRLLRDEIGYHEMCNSWLSSDPWELTQECVDKKLEILGHCRDIIPKICYGDTLDVGVCVQDEDGDRFWCHFRSENIQALVRRYDRYQEWKKMGEKEELIPQL